VACKFAELKENTDHSSGKEGGPKFVKPGHVAVIDKVLRKSMCVEFLSFSVLIAFHDVRQSLWVSSQQVPRRL
jgi:hypothetical protein